MHICDGGVASFSPRRVKYKSRREREEKAKNLIQGSNRWNDLYCVCSVSISQAKHRQSLAFLPPPPPEPVVNQYA